MASLWFLIVGVLLLGIAMVGSVVKRLPLSTAILYLGIGYGLGPQASGLIDIDPIRQAAFIERVTEVAIIVSLFTAGLKLRISVDLGNSVWGKVRGRRSRFRRLRPLRPN
jgi:NhaP-type Na+/H+ or K+/H+ antiporter